MKKIIGFLIVVAIVILAVYHALIYYDNNFRYGRMRETPAVRPFEEPLLVKEAGLVPVNGGEAIYRVSAGTGIQSPIDMAQPAVIARGKAVYLIYCAQCHGHNYDGKGTDYYAETWAYDYSTDTWTQMNPTNHPSARMGYAFTCDLGSGQVVLFGGRGASGFCDDTWLYGPAGCQAPPDWLWPGWNWIWSCQRTTSKS